MTKNSLRCEGPHRLAQRRPPTPVSLLQSLAAAEIANIRLSRACQRGASKSASVQPCVPRRDRPIAGQGGREPARRDRPPDDGAEPPFDRRHRPANGFCRSLPHAPRLPARLWTAATGDPTKRACGSGGVNVDPPARRSGGPSQAARERPLCVMSGRSIIDTHRPILRSVFNSSTSLDQLLPKPREKYWPAIKSAQAASIRKTPVAKLTSSSSIPDACNR